MKREWIFFLACSMLLSGVMVGGTYFIAENIRQGGLSGQAVFAEIGEAIRFGSEEKEKNKSYELVLTRTYLCGVKDEKRITVKPDTLQQTLGEYEGWEIIAFDQGRLALSKRENDIAPSCKANGYFGLSADGVLTLFNGVPSEQKVIQSFYQINTAKMEAVLPKEEVNLLKNGIRVRDLSEYNSVLSTYSEFQTGEASTEDQ